VLALVAIGTDLYAAGAFTMAGTVAADTIAKWNGTTWSAIGAGTNDVIDSIAAIGTDLYIGGDFTIVEASRAPESAESCPGSGPGSVRAAAPA